MKRFVSLLMFLIVLFLQCSKSPSSSDITNTPIFTIDTEDSNVRDGDSVATDSIRVVLDISATTLRYQFRWKLDNGTWEDWIEGSEDLLNIMFKDIDPGEHTLTIEVRYRSDDEVADSVITFFIAEKPVVTAVSSKSITVDPGTNCTLWVTAEGTAPLNYLWYKDGDKIDNNQMDSLVLANVSSDDAGKYRCEVGNRWGEAESEKITLSVAEHFRVIYKGNGNTDGNVPVDDNEYKKDDTITVLGVSKNFVKTGYTFVGWNSSKAGDGVEYPVDTVFLMGTNTLTLYAHWIKLSPRDIMYHANGSTGGKVPEDTTDYSAGDTVIILGNTGNLVKTGHSFSGWNTEMDGTGTTFAPLDTLFIDDTSVTLYAEWAPLECTITFDSRGGSIIGKQTVEYGSKADEPTAPVKEDYTFIGWFKDKDGVVEWQFDTDTVTADMTLYAKWSTGKDIYKVKIAAPDHGDIQYKGVSVSDEYLQVDAGDSLTLTAVPAESYHFTCWRTVSGDVEWSDSLSDTTTLSLASNSEIEAVFERDSVTLHVDINGPGLIRYHGDTIDGDSIRILANIRDSIECIASQQDWMVAGWETVHGTPTVYSDDEGKYVFLLNGSATVKVTIEESFDLTVGSTGNGRTNLSGTIKVPDNAVTTISAEPAKYSYFRYWRVTEGYPDIENPNDPVTTITLTHGDASVKAVFEYLDTIWIPVTFYDFHSDKSNPEFESPHNGGSYKNMVTDTLDRDGKPAIGTDPYLNYYIKYWFRSWADSAQGDSTVPVYKCTSLYCENDFGVQMRYDGIDSVNHDTAFINMVIEDSLPFLLVDNFTVPSGTYRFSDEYFFPLDGRGFGEEGKTHNYSFTMEMHLDFIYESGLEFHFRGDDDVWAFIDGQLEMDLGGIHQAWSDVIYLDQISGLVEGEEYPLNLFYCERHTDGSSIRITTNVFRAIGYAGE